MKKRNKPYLILTLLVVAGAVAFGMNYSSSEKGGPGNEAPPQDQKVLDQSREKETKSDVANSVKQTLGAKSAPSAPPGMPGKSGPMVPSVVAKPKASAYKPQPSDSSISTQWYSDESLNGNK